MWRGLRIALRAAHRCGTALWDWWLELQDSEWNQREWPPAAVQDRWHCRTMRVLAFVQRPWVITIICVLMLAGAWVGAILTGGGIARWSGW